MEVYLTPWLAYFRLEASESMILESSFVHYDRVDAASDYDLARKLHLTILTSLSDS